MAHVFFSYSHADEELRNELEKHLAGLLRQGVITTWHDRRIGPGEELHGQIDEQLNAADIVLLLVSADFLASDYCHDVEMMRAMERHERGEARVIPVILRPCDWHGAPFGTLMAVPPDGKPVVKHATLDDGFLEVVKAVRQVAGPAHSRGPAARASQPAPGLDPQHHRARVRAISGSAASLTDRDRHAFLTESFEYIARYFENSLSELQARNDRVETDFRRIDANRFEARGFVGGEKRALCGIWLDGAHGTNGLYCSFNGAAPDGYNESMSVVGQRLHAIPRAAGHGTLFRPARGPSAHHGGRCRVFLEPLRRTAQIASTDAAPRPPSSGGVDPPGKCRAGAVRIVAADPPKYPRWLASAGAITQSTARLPIINLFGRLARTGSVLCRLAALREPLPSRAASETVMRHRTGGR